MKMVPNISAKVLRSIALALPVRLEVGVAVELALVEALQRLALRDGHAAVADGALAIARQRRIQLRHVVLHVFKNFDRGIALDDLLDPPAALVVQADMDDGGDAKEIGAVPEPFPGSPPQKPGQGSPPPGTQARAVQPHLGGRQRY